MNPGVKTALRTLEVFEAFEALKRPLSLTEVSQHIGAPMSSCHELLRTLRMRGYLYPVGRPGHLYPTRRLSEIAGAIAAADPILRRIEPVLERLREYTRETVIVGKRVDDRVVYLDLLEGLHTIRYTARVGDFKPLHSSAIGKAALGALPLQERATLVGKLDLVSVTDATQVDPEDLLADLEAGCESGVFVTRGENVVDVMALATPVARSGDAFAIAVAGPLHRMDASFDAFRQALLVARAEIEAQP